MILVVLTFSLSTTTLTGLRLSILLVRPRTHHRIFMLLITVYVKLLCSQFGSPEIPPFPFSRPLLVLLVSHV